MPFKCSLCFGISIVLFIIFVGTEYYFQTKHTVPWPPLPTSHASNNKSCVRNGTDKSHKKPLNGKDKPTKIFKMLWFVPPTWLSEKKTHIMDYCEFKNCEISFNKNDIENSDLVLFNHAEMNIQPPVKRNNQIWVFSSHESPPHTHKYYRQNQWVDKFDWTFSYRPDSEGYGPYGNIVLRETIKERNYSAIFENKSKDVAWVVSNCETISKRKQYVQKMRKIINVDIFGKCGKPCDDKGGGCKFNQSKYYKFYLAFENSMCKDYITEKLYDLFKDDTDFVPVVRGAPNVKEMFPANTLILALDYNSPEELAHYLKESGANETAYLSYLKGKDKYINKSDFFVLGMCSLCDKLNNKFKRRTPIDILQLMSNKQCVLPNDF